MSKAFIAFLIFLTPLVLFIVWMNLTPGHFNDGACGCSLEYSSGEYQSETVGEDGVTYLVPPICPAVVCEPTRSIFILPVLLFSLLDFNK